MRRRCSYRFAAAASPLLLLLLLLAAAARAAGAQLTLHTLFNDGVVLQRGAACVFGGSTRSDANATATLVELLWTTAAQNGTADAPGGAVRVAAAPDGAWRACLPPHTPYGGPHTLRIRQLPANANATSADAASHANADDDIVLSDVLIGDVWLASGQSNMAFPTSKALNASAECAAADTLPRRAFLRFMTVPGGPVPAPDAPRPQLPSRAVWEAPNAAVACRTSAVAFFFARALAAARPHAPLGVIIAAVDGTSISGWTPLGALGACGAECGTLPAAWYNAKVAPLRGVGLRGVFWWQGEDDVACANYDCRLRALIASWRAECESPARNGTSAEASAQPLPFLLVQLQPFFAAFAAPACAVDGSAWSGPSNASHVAAARLTQAAVAASVPGVGLASAIDLGDAASPWWPGSIHPRHKKTVGERLALQARVMAHGEQQLVARGPALRGVTQLALPAVKSDGTPAEDARNVTSGGGDAATRDVLRDAGPLLAAFRLHFHVCGAPPAGSGNASEEGVCEAALRLRRAMAPSSPIQFTARFADGSRGAAAAVHGSGGTHGSDGTHFILGVPDVWDRGREELNASKIERLEAYASDFPIALVWNDAGLPMEPWSVALTPGADGLLRWGWQPPEEVGTGAAAEKKERRRR
jgi:sialate O-acetylesterase